MDETTKIRALIAEDEESFLKVLTTSLEATGRFEVYPCESGDEAVEALKVSRYDIIILDYKMPGMTGLNVLQWMHEQKMATPVIMLTGAGSENIATEAMKLGAYDYMRKDRFERDHFPIFVRGIREKYLFRREKEERERNIALVEMIHNTITSLSELVQGSVARLAFLSDELERILSPQLSHAGKELLEKNTKKTSEELETLAFAMKSMLNLPRSAKETISLTEDFQDKTEKVPVSSPTSPR
jgi:DNA-binding response OmpR family regulator